MATFGLIGRKLGHSFSQKFFSEKFKNEALPNKYELFEIDNIGEIAQIFSQEGLAGLNVTIPYKEAIIDYLDKLDSTASRVGAVNVVKITNGQKTGYNSDYYGFEKSLLDWLPHKSSIQALVLGSGGASKAVSAVLNQNKIPFAIVSRKSNSGDLTYDQLKNNPKFLSTHHLIINTTPLGMYPTTDDMPDIPYSELTPRHHLYDLVYNPEKTKFLKAGQNYGCQIKNGLEMLHLQAEKSWDIWSQDDS